MVLGCTPATGQQLQESAGTYCCTHRVAAPCQHRHGAKLLPSCRPMGRTGAACHARRTPRCCRLRHGWYHRQCGAISAAPPAVAARSPFSFAGCRLLLSLSRYAPHPPLTPPAMPPPLPARALCGHACRGTVMPWQAVTLDEIAARQGQLRAGKTKFIYESNHAYTYMYTLLRSIRLFPFETTELHRNATKRHHVGPQPCIRSHTTRHCSVPGAGRLPGAGPAERHGRPCWHH